MIKIRQIFVILGLIIFLSCSVKHSKFTDLEKMNLNGKVESIRFSLFQAVEKNGRIQKQPIESSDETAHVDNEFHFNEKGMINRHIQYISNEMTHKYVYSYDRNLCTTSKIIMIIQEKW